MDNPAGPGAVFLLEAQAADGSSRVVGCAGVGRRMLQAGSSRRRGFLLVDFAVDPEHRSLMPALRLQRAARAWIETQGGIAYSFPNPPAIGVFRRLRYREITVFRHVRVLRYERYVARVVPLRAVARLLGAALDAAGGTVAAFSRGGPKGYRLEWLREADARFDQLWEETRGLHAVVGDRDARFLRWRFGSASGTGAELAALLHEESGCVRAYAAVVSKEPGVVRIDDFLAITPDDLALLWRRLMPELRGRGFSSAAAQYSGPRQMTHTLTRSGFVVRDGSPVVVGVFPASEDGADLLSDPSGWHLTHADRDP